MLSKVVGVLGIGLEGDFGRTKRAVNSISIESSFESCEGIIPFDIESEETVSKQPRCRD